MPNDVAKVATLLGDYMRETFNDEWHGSHAKLLADGFGAKFDLIVAERGAGQIVGFCAWARAYDLHHCVAGATVCDMYVTPEFRGHALPLLLLAELASQVEHSGGCFISGQAVTSPGVQTLYERVAISFPGANCILGGRAFRTFAELARKPARFVVKNLPNKAWNHEG